MTGGHRRPAPRSAVDIHHPGPRAADRWPAARGRAVPLALDLDAGADLTQALGRGAEAAGAQSAVFHIDGLALRPFDYVMPASAVDDRHVAWYSDTYRSEAAELTAGVAVLGRKDGAWFLHVHADWRQGEARAVGHLLPPTLTVAAPARITGLGIAGAAFEVQSDPETEFPLFRVTGGGPEGDAVIATVAPHADLTRAVTALAAPLGDARVLGLGSLCGAAFQEGIEMTCPVSEILLGASAHVRDGAAHLPCTAVDLQGGLFEGWLVPGRAPVLVTAEVLLVADRA